MMATILCRAAMVASASAMLLGSSACGRQPAAASTTDDGRASAAASPSPPAATRSTSRPAAPGTQAAPTWNGRYVYEFDGGRTVGGSAETVTYTLALDGGGCRFEAEGFQTDEAIVCSARPSAGNLDILFRSYAGGGTRDRYGNAVYSVGDPLFSLSKAGTGLVTHWKGYPLPDDKPHAPGTYFHR